MTSNTSDFGCYFTDRNGNRVEVPDEENLNTLLSKPTTPLSKTTKKRTKTAKLPGSTTDPTLETDKAVQTFNAPDLNDYIQFTLSCIYLVGLILLLSTLIFATVYYYMNKAGYFSLYILLTAFVIMSSVCIIVYSIYNWNINIIANLLSYVYEWLVSILLYISDKFATLDVRVAKYQTLDNYLVIFHILSGLAGLAYWIITKVLLKNLLYVQAAVFVYQVIKYVYYNIYPELVRIIMNFIEWAFPHLCKLLKKLVVNIEYMCKIVLVSFKICWASMIYMMKLLHLFWIPVALTIVVVAGCLVY